MQKLADTSEECGNKNILYHSPNSDPNTDHYILQTDSKQGNAFGHISCCALKNHIYKHTQIYTYI